jgi:hypothetical protein
MSPVGFEPKISAGERPQADTRKPRKPVDLKRDVREGRREEYQKMEWNTKKTQNYININN